MSESEKSYLKQWLATVAASLTVVLLVQSVVLVWSVASQRERFEQIVRTVNEIAPQHRELWFEHQREKRIKNERPD